MPHADELLGAPQVRALAAAIAAAAPGANTAPLGAAAEALGTLALRERVDLVSAAILQTLPGDYASLARVVREAAADEDFAGWLIWPVTEAVVARAETAHEGAADGLAPDAFDDSMALLAELTGRLTSEFAIRTPLRRDPQRGLAIATVWTASHDEHVRRLASEGTRPYLPWGTKVPGLFADPTSTLPILDALYRDDSEYVRRSVANHLNDLSRHAPELVVATAGRWLAAPDANTERTVKHALRTLVKRGDPEALALLGFTADDISVCGQVLDADAVAVGDSLGFTGSVRNLAATSARVAIDYVVHHAKANGSQTEKVFKLATVTLAPGEAFDIARSHSFKVITTRRYHPGAHALELQVNGRRFGRAEFELLAP